MVLPSIDEVLRGLADPKEYKGLRILLKNIENEDEDSFDLCQRAIIRTIQSTTCSLNQKLYSIKLLKDIIETGVLSFVDRLDKTICNHLFQVCVFRIGPELKKGERFFIQAEKRPDTEESRSMSYSYSIFVSEAVTKWASWLKPFDEQQQINTFQRIIKALQSKGWKQITKFEYFKPADEQRFMLAAKKWNQKQDDEAKPSGDSSQPTQPKKQSQSKSPRTLPPMQKSQELQRIIKQGKQVSQQVQTLKKTIVVQKQTTAKALSGLKNQIGTKQQSIKDFREGIQKAERFKSQRQIQYQRLTRQFKQSLTGNSNLSRLQQQKNKKTAELAELEKKHSRALEQLKNAYQAAVPDENKLKFQKTNLEKKIVELGQLLKEQANSNSSLKLEQDKHRTIISQRSDPGQTLVEQEVLVYDPRDKQLIAALQEEIRCARDKLARQKAEAEQRSTLQLKSQQLKAFNSEQSEEGRKTLKVRRSEASYGLPPQTGSGEKRYSKQNWGRISQVVGGRPSGGQQVKFKPQLFAPVKLGMKKLRRTMLLGAGTFHEEGIFKLHFTSEQVRECLNCRILVQSHAEQAEFSLRYKRDVLYKLVGRHFKGVEMRFGEEKESQLEAEMVTPGYQPPMAKLELGSAAMYIALPFCFVSFCAISDWPQGLDLGSEIVSEALLLSKELNWKLLAERFRGGEGRLRFLAEWQSHRFGVVVAGDHGFKVSVHFSEREDNGVAELLLQTMAFLLCQP